MPSDLNIRRMRASTVIAFLMATNQTPPPIIYHHVFAPNLITMISLSSAPRRKPFRSGILSQSSSSPKSAETAQASSHGIRLQTKKSLFGTLQGIDRGIFGVTSAKKAEIDNMVQILESITPNPQPTLCMEKLGGEWRLIYSTIAILGSKRTKLGLRDFITLGDFNQYIDFAQGKAVNVIKFSARGLSALSGELRVEASFRITSESRVDITFIESDITPDKLMNVFRKNYDILLSIFNPDGWLEITYVDESLRIGRDNKGNMFILERTSEVNS